MHYDSSKDPAASTLLTVIPNRWQTHRFVANLTGHHHYRTKIAMGATDYKRPITAI